MDNDAASPEGLARRRVVGVSHLVIVDDGAGRLVPDLDAEPVGAAPAGRLPGGGREEVFTVSGAAGALIGPTEGVTLRATSANVVAAALLDAPLLSLAVMVTVWLCAGPSVVPYDQLHVPSERFTTEPTDALRVTSSPASWSDHVPVFDALEPSSADTDAASAPTLGAWLTLLIVTVAVYSRTPPSLSLILPPVERAPAVVVGQSRLFAAPKAP